MYKRVLASSNSLVRTLVDSNFFVTSRIFKQWMQILFSNYMCRLHFSRVTTHLCFNCVSVYMYTLYSMYYYLQNKSFQSINQSKL